MSKAKSSINSSQIGLTAVFKGVAMKQITIILSILLLSSGCVVVGGYSSERGWFVWPGTIVIFAVVALLFLVLRRRR